MRCAAVTVCLLALVAVGCGSGSAAKAARDDVPTAGTAMGDEPCLAGEEAQPWTFDMAGTTRGSLFEGMKSGLVFVKFDCKKLEVMSRCKASGIYDYGYYPSEAEVLDFKDSDEIKANLSGGAAIAAKFEAEMKRGAKLFIAYAVGGRSTTTVPDVGRDQIKGPKSCDKATHYVAEVHFGAYKMEASANAEMKAAVDIFGRGASAGSQSSAETAGKSGDPASCERGTERDNDAPRGCNTVVRVTLAPILPAGEGGKPEVVAVKAELPRPPPGCPPGMERVGMMCRRAGASTSSRPRTCRAGDASDCERQCQAGEPLSCAMVGAMYERGTGVKPSAQTAFKYYKQACSRGNIDGCTGQAYLYSKGEGGITEDGPKAEKMFIEACKRGNGRACSGLGQRIRLKGNVRNALPHFARGCQLGYARACFYQGSFGSTTTQAPEITLKAFERACFGRDLRGCLGAVTILKSGKASSNFGSVGMYLKMGLGGLERACSSNDGESCKVLGDYHAGKYDPQTRDPGKARSFYEQACRAGQKDACKADVAKGPPPGKGPPKATPTGAKPLPPPPPPPPRKKSK